MSPTTLITGTAIGGTLFALWPYVKGFINRIRSFLFLKVTLDSTQLSSALMHFCWMKCKRRKLGGDYTYGADRWYLPKLRKWQMILYERLGCSSVIFFYKWMPIVILQEQGDGNNRRSTTALWMIRGTVNIDQFMIDVKNHYCTCRDEGIENERFKIKNKFGTLGQDQSNGAEPADWSTQTNDDEFILSSRLLDVTHHDLLYNTRVNFLTSLALPKHVEELIEDAKLWKQSELWYNERDIPWKRAWMLYGPPGTGKSSLAKAVAQLLDLPLNLYSLSTFDNRSFINSWEDNKSFAPCMALIEDIDTVFHGRNNVNKNMEGTSLTFDTLLNCIDGVNSSNGVFTIITTNRPEFVDAALADFSKTPPQGRAGRIDRVIHLDFLDEHCSRQIAERILKDCPDLIEDAIKYGTGNTGAAMQLHCSLLALRRYHKDKKNAS